MSSCWTSCRFRMNNPVSNQCPPPSPTPPTLTPTSRTDEPTSLEWPNTSRSEIFRIQKFAIAGSAVIINVPSGFFEAINVKTKIRRRRCMRRCRKCWSKAKSSRSCSILGAPARGRFRPSKPMRFDKYSSCNKFIRESTRSNQIALKYTKKLSKS